MTTMFSPLVWCCLFLLGGIPMATSNADCTSSPIVIVGSGLAGHSAAATALRILRANDDPRKVIILEKEPKFGGNSMKATSGINGALTKFQAAAGVEDDVNDFKHDTLYSASGGGQYEMKENELVSILTAQSGDAVNWLSSEFELDISALSQCGGHSHKRTHRPPRGPAGFIIVKTIHSKLENTDIEFRYQSRVIEILKNEDTQQVHGVVYRNADGEAVSLEASAVILTSGGYANDHTEDSLLQRFAMDVISLPTTNGPWATGDGVKLGAQIGASLVDMDKVQIHPTGFINPKKPDDSTKFLAPEALRGSGGIMLNFEGRRFVNELDLRSKVVAAMRAQGDPTYYLLLNEESAGLFGPNLGFYEKKIGVVTKYESVAAFAEAFGLSAEIVVGSVNEYNQYANGDGEDPFGKTVFPVKQIDVNAPIFAAKITPVIHYTMGGLAIDEMARILDLDGRPMKGLFGAGEVTGGVHGANRLAGNSLLECVVYGRIAGASAARFDCRSGKDEL